jgi:hypothetical protein
VPVTVADRGAAPLAGALGGVISAVAGDIGHDPSERRTDLVYHDR